jgi:hypothetical protein
MGTHDGKAVRFLRKLDVWGVAPVQRGAGIGTRTVDIKALDAADSHDGADDGQARNGSPSEPLPSVVGKRIEMQIIEQ